MRPDAPDPDRHRRSLRRRLRGRPDARLFAEPGGGAGWLLARVPSARLTRRRARADIVAAPLAFDGVDAAAAALVREAFEASPFRRGALADDALVALAAWSAGLPTVARAIGRRAAEVGPAIAREELERGALPRAASEALRREVGRRLHGLDAGVQRGLAIVSRLAHPLDAAEAEPLAGLDRAALAGLHDRGLLRCLEDDRVWVAPPLAAIARDLGERDAIDAAVARWAARLHEASEWVGRPSAQRALVTHGASFAAIASGQARPEARAGAALGWLVHARDAGTDRAAEGHAVRALLDAPPRAGHTRALRHALGEAMRAAGQPGALAAALGELDDPRSELIRARALFNAGDADGARVRLDACLERPGLDAATVAGAWLTIGYVERDRGQAEAAFAALDEADRRYRALGGARWMVEARMCRGLVWLELGSPRRAAAALGDAPDGDALTPLREAMAALPATRAGVLASYVTLARELGGHWAGAARAIAIALEAPTPPLFRALFRTYAARVALARGAPEEARVHLAPALETLRAAGAAPSRSTALALDALARVASGEDAEATFAEADRLAARPDRRQVVAIATRTAALLAAHPLTPGEAAPPLDEAVTAALRRLAPRPEGEHDSLHVRCAYATAEAIVAARVAAIAAHESVTVDASARAFAYRGRRVCLAQRSGPWRVLEVLVEAGGAPVTARELTARVWGRGLVADSGANRLRVALSHLRAAGLRDALERTGRSYALRAPVSSPLKNRP